MGSFALVYLARIVDAVVDAGILCESASPLKAQTLGDKFSSTDIDVCNWPLDIFMHSGHDKNLSEFAEVLAAQVMTSFALGSRVWSPT